MKVEFKKQIAKECLWNDSIMQILKENDNYCIVGNYDNEDLKSLGFNTQEINNMKNISIYDEIVMNPKIQ